MKSFCYLQRQAIVLLLLLFCISASHAQRADYNYLTVINFYNNYYDNVIDTTGNALFEEEWTYILSLPECEKFFGIRMLSDVPEDHLPAFDMVPAEYAILSPDGSKIILNYKEISSFNWGPPFTVRTDEGWGLIDCNNEWLVEPVYDFEPSIREHYMLLSEFHFDSITAEYGPDWNILGIADFEGNVIAAPYYTDIFSFYWWKDPPYVVMRGDSSSLLDSRGKMLIPMGDYYLYPSLTDESVWVINDTEEKVFYPGTGKWVTENTRDLMKGLYGCQAGFKLMDIVESYNYVQWNCLDGTVRIYADLESIRQSFIHPYRRIEKDEKYGVISKYGDTILPCIYDNIYEEYNQEIHEHNVMQCVFEGMISVEMDGYWGLIDTSGRHHTHFVYDELLGVSEGIVAAKVEGRAGFIDIHGNSIIPFVFDNSERPWKNGVGWVSLGDDHLLFNKNGDIIASESGTIVPFTVNNLKDEEQIPRSEYWLLDRMDENGDLYTEDTYLDPAGAGLSYIPEEIALFPNLEELEISDNYISHVEYELSQFPNLARIGLAANLFEEFPVSVLKVETLSTLDLDANHIQQLPAELFTHPALTELWLNDNSIKSFPEIQRRNNTLELMSLGNNQIKSLPSSISNLSKLTSLELAENQLSDLPNEINVLKKLGYLGLNDNMLKKLPEDMSGLKSLHTIDLENNQLEAVPESLLKLRKLQYLILKGNPIPQEELDRISELRPELELFEK